MSNKENKHDFDQKKAMRSIIAIRLRIAISMMKKTSIMINYDNDVDDDNDGCDPH